ncbi:MAG: hypothetical protein CM15mP49_34030 [Actinomycetota bacterium]|nr:MAG: hypothetical protein CM15mP49_34030 [Actinomycetota bacterium]
MLGYDDKYGIRVDYAVSHEFRPLEMVHDLFGLQMKQCISVNTSFSVRDRKLDET